MLLLTLQLMAVSVVIAACVGIPGAWAASTLQQSGRWGNRLAGLVMVVLVAAIALPMILHAAAWEATAGKFGWLSMTQTGARVAGDVQYGGLGGMFSGLIACGWIHGMYSAALVTLATWLGVRRVSAAAMQQSAIDLGPVASWWKVRLPIAWPWVVTSLLATAVIATTEMTVVDLYGYRTIADRFYLQYVVDPTPLAIVQTCLLPMLFAAGIVLLLGRFADRKQAIQVGADAAQPIEESPRWIVCLAFAVCLLLTLVMVVVPLAGLLIKIGHDVVVENGQRSVSWSPQRCWENLVTAPTLFVAEYKWTVLLAGLTGAIACLLGNLAAALGRQHSRWERLFDAATIIMILIPGPIVGLAVVSLFQTGVPGFRTLYNSSLVPAIMGLLFRAGPVAYWVLRSGYRGIGDEVFTSARLEMGWLRRIWSVDRPLLGRRLLGAFIAAAIVASGDVPVMLPVIPPGVTTVGTRLFEQLHSGARYQEASLAIWYVLGVSIVAVIGARLGTPTRARL